MTTELTFLSRQWQVSHAPPLFSLWMASSEVDQKFLGHFAKTCSEDNVYLSSMVRRSSLYFSQMLTGTQLYKILGLSVILSEKLLRARKNRRLDPTRDTKSVRQLYHHILWLSREGLVIVEQYILPMVGQYIELKVLSYKLRASFYHIYVLFHNQPSVNRAGDPFALFPDPLSPRGSKNGTNRDSIQRSPPQPRRSSRTTGGPVGGGPPGLPPPPQKTSPSASFLLPAMDYIPTATSCFVTANTLAERLLPGSHPVRLSVKVEYVAYLYDCLHDGEESRRLAKRSIADVYNAQEGMDDESFEDAAELVGILGKMMKRGLGGSVSGSGSGSTPGLRGGGAGGSQASRSTPRVQEQRPSSQQRQERRVTPPRGTNGLPAAMPSPGMTNPI